MYNGNQIQKTNNAQVITYTYNTYNHTYVAIYIILLFYILFFFQSYHLEPITFLIILRFLI